MHRIQVPTLEH